MPRRAACLSFSDSQIQSRDKARARKMAWGPHTVTQRKAGSPLEIVILPPPSSSQCSFRVTFGAARVIVPSDNALSVIKLPPCSLRTGVSNLGNLNAIPRYDFKTANTSMASWTKIGCNASRLFIIVSLSRAKTVKMLLHRRGSVTVNAMC